MMMHCYCSRIKKEKLQLADRTQAAGSLDEKAARKVLESMVMSRAISHLQQKEMTAEEQAEITNEVAVFEEQLLVRRYLAKHGKPQPITMEAIQEYYDAHPELFGAHTISGGSSGTGSSGDRI